MSVYCKKCHLAKRGCDYQKAKGQIEAILNTKLEERCVSYCGPGKTEFFVEIEDEIFAEETLEKLLERLKGGV